MSVKFNAKHLNGFVRDEEFAAIYPQVELAHQMLESKTGPGNDFLGWTDLPVAYDKEEFARIKAAAARIRSDSDVLVVIGIGGSYLGARAVIEAVKGAMYNCTVQDGPRSSLPATPSARPICRISWTAARQACQREHHLQVRHHH